MTDQRWPSVKALFQAAVERPPDERGAFLAQATGDDDALRREVESLLASDASDVSFLGHLPVACEAVLAGPLAAPLALMPPAPAQAVLASGHRVGCYEVVAPIGAGGMGEVYRARDTKLNREVALKVLPDVFALDADRLARFTREAQLLAALNHPNIAAIYGLEEANPAPGSGRAATQALVLELVDGPTLADRIALGPLSIDETLAIACQMADALEAAHEKGIIHRDLKPANIKIAGNGVVKVLDFGLAKVWDGAPQRDLSASPRLTATDIGARIILGTPAYMSPEQARGRPLDRRTDMWSFGCVLYEMLTGRLAFAGDTISDTLAAILEREPDRTMLPADTPLPIRRLLQRCFQKDRKRRLDSAAGARLEIDDAIAPPPGALSPALSRRDRPVAILVLAGVAVIAAVVAGIQVWPRPGTPVLSSRFAIAPPRESALNVSGPDRDLAVSPDGRRLVYRVGGSETNGSPLMMRAFDQLEALPVADVRAAYAPFFSPDSRWIGFFEQTVLKKVSIAGGPVITLCQVNGLPLGASWGDDNTIAFATNRPGTGLWRVSAEGGEPTVLTTPDPAHHERNDAFPSMLPDGRGVLFTVAMATAGQADSTQVAVLDFETGQRKILIRGGGDARYVKTGHLIFAAAGTLRAVRFDPARLEVLSEPVTVVEHMLMKRTGAANYAVSGLGTLVYMPGEVGGQTAVRSLVWVDRKGHETPVNAPPRAYGPPRVSPDGTRVATAIQDQGNTEIWIWNLARETLRPLTFAAGMNGLPVWTPDGRRIVFMSDRTGVLNLYSQAADGSGTVDRLTTSPHPQWPNSIAPDGTHLFGFDNQPQRAGGVIMVPLTGSADSPTRAGPVAQKLFSGVFAEIAPDGRYLAYQSDESGRYEIYVRPFPQVDRGRWQISTAGGTRAVWARSGREIFFLDESNTLTGVRVSTSGPTFSMGIPARIFESKYAEPNPARHYDVSPDGQRFLMIKDTPAGDPNSMVVVLNWFEELKQRVPTNGK